jgi:serine/threonine protein kinase
MQVLKMADFGFAKKASFGTGTVIGTEYFMSPEIYAQGVEGSEGEKYGFEVDVWSCGVLLFYMLNACFPFRNTVPMQRYSLPGAVRPNSKNSANTQNHSAIGR